MWEVLTFGFRPYYEVTNKHVRSTILAGLRLQCPTGCPYELYAIMEKCWAKEPTERISAAQAEEELRNIFHAMKTNQPRKQTWSSTDPHEYLSLAGEVETSTDPEKEKISMSTSSSLPVAADDITAANDSDLPVMLTTPTDQFLEKVVSLTQSTMPFPAGKEAIELVSPQGNNPKNFNCYL